MSNLSDVGNLMYLDLDIIESGDVTNTSEYLINATAKELSNTDGRNWIPLIVKEIAEDEYQIIGNYFVYAVAEAAGLEKVWCIIADNSEATEKVTKMLAGEAIPKINLSTASRDEIKSALEYLVEQPNTNLKGVKIPVATNRIDEAPRQYWQDLSPITNLKCGITKGKKLQALEKVFYLTPQSIPDDLKNSQVLNSLTVTELKKIAKKRKLTNYGKLNKKKLVDLLSEN
ncbi:Rho termination factor [Hyella patelloides LEGE 07179]|uniref:Rho termination factor n=1 Tax=Hyella patelloides LEGE 07179 TaxID=945734 RepID=A0A563VZ45_9CYAN|nr:Rho termination factor [Hyella patelloides]VEP16724.1 Rho termination factor [Hyella patelloides LEGE 07179]